MTLLSCPYNNFEKSSSLRLFSSARNGLFGPAFESSPATPAASSPAVDGDASSPSPFPFPS